MKSFHPKYPKYVQLAEHLRETMQAGVLQAGDQLPSLAQLNAQFGASQATVERAHAILERDGLIVRSQGKGVFVAEPRLRATLGTVGCVLPPPEVSLQFSYYSRLISGIRAVASRENVEVMLLNDSPTSGWEKVDGALFFGESRRDLPHNLPISMPHVGLMVAFPGAPSVCADDYRGTREATEYLIGLGHRRIAYLTDALWVPKNTPISQQRLHGYHDALRAAGIEPRDEWQWDLAIQAAEFLERGRDSMRAWLQNGWQELGCTALLVHNDRAAIGAMDVLKEAGIRIPQDVSVIGFDSTDECELVSPRLTSVRVPLAEIGARATELLLRRIRGEESEPQTITSPVQLEVRDSTAQRQ